MVLATDADQVMYISVPWSWSWLLMLKLQMCIINVCFVCKIFIRLIMIIVEWNEMMVLCLPHLR